MIDNIDSKKEPIAWFLVSYIVIIIINVVAGLLIWDLPGELVIGCWLWLCVVVAMWAHSWGRSWFFYGILAVLPTLGYAIFAAVHKLSDIHFVAAFALSPILTAALLMIVDDAAQKPS